MRRTLAAAAIVTTLFVPSLLASAGAAAAETGTAVASTGSAGFPEIPPSCVGKIDPIMFYIQSLFGTQPRHCL